MPIDHDAVRCDWCHALILWTVTAAGRRLPVDAEPNEAGNVAIYRDAPGTLRSRAIAADRPGLDHLERRMMPHAASCSRPKSSRPARQPQGVRPYWQQGRPR